MHYRFGKTKTDLGLRLSGFLLCGMSWLAITVFRIRTSFPTTAPGPEMLALAAIGFVCASGGAFLAVLGHHVFDETEVGERWRPHTIDPLPKLARTL